ncbi:tyrosine-protein phosphatase [Thermodesulfobacteriota bacterium]
MPEQLERNISTQGIFNFRDLGGYRVGDGRRIRSRRLFRSGELQYMTETDLSYLRDNIKLATIINLRRQEEVSRNGIDCSAWPKLKYRNNPLTGGHTDRVTRLSSVANMGELYELYLGQEEYGRKIVKAVKIIAEPENLPLVFHCAAGKDRTGMLAAVLLGALGVSDEDIIKDYVMSVPQIQPFKARLHTNPELAEELERIPLHAWKAESESMVSALSFIKVRFGTMRDYVEAHGGDLTLLSRLEEALLT